METDPLITLKGSDTGHFASRDWIPRRLIITFMLGIGFLIGCAQRIVISIAIIPIVDEVGYNEFQQGMILSAFGWGYMLTPIIGSWIEKKLGGKTVLGWALASPGIFVFIFPFTIRPTVTLSVLAYFLFGFTQGPLWPGNWSIINQWIPLEEKSTVIAFVNLFGLMGTAIPLGFGPFIIEWLHWPSLFFIAGGAGIVWGFVWLIIGKSTPESSDLSILHVTQKEIEFIAERRPKIANLERIPWSNILRNRVVWVFIIAQFSHNWGYYITVAWVPTYLKKSLGFNLREAGYLSVLPYLLCGFIGQVAGVVADLMIKRNILSRLNTRKFFQTCSFVPGAVLFFVIGTVELDAIQIVVLLTTAVGISGFSCGGISSSYGDITNTYSGAIHSISNTFATLPGGLGIFLVGFILEVTHENWSVVWILTASLLLLAEVIFIFCAGAEMIDFDDESVEELTEISAHNKF